MMRQLDQAMKRFDETLATEWVNAAIAPLWQRVFTLLENQGGKKDEHLWQQLEEIHKMYQEGFYVAATDILQEFNPLGTDGRSLCIKILCPP